MPEGELFLSRNGSPQRYESYFSQIDKPRLQTDRYQTMNPVDMSQITIHKFDDDNYRTGNFASLLEQSEPKNKFQFLSDTDDE